MQDKIREIKFESEDLEAIRLPHISRHRDVVPEGLSKLTGI
jgi:hypothetical protein